jgi:hypothetical protein
MLRLTSGSDKTGGSIPIIVSIDSGKAKIQTATANRRQIQSKSKQPTPYRIYWVVLLPSSTVAGGAL